MRNVFKALLILAAVLAALPGAAPAASRTPARLSATTLPGAAMLSGESDATTLAYTAPGQTGAITLLADGGAPAALAAPAPGCTADAVGSGLLAWTCGETYTDPRNAPTTMTRDIAVTRLDGSVEARFSVPLENWQKDEPVPMTSIGSRWVRYIRYPGTECQLCDWAGNWPVDWHTATVIYPQPQPATVWQDLDAPAFNTALCAPLRLATYPDEIRGPNGPAVEAFVHSPYALVDTYIKGRAGWALRRCGSSKAIALPGGLQPASLGYGWVAARSGATIDLVRLRDRKSYAVRGVPSTAAREGTLAFTRGHLYIGAPGGGISAIALPKR
jgi:hypothetical protein